jgi:hypothetical protein
MRAESIIQRDAIIAALATAGINAFAETRDISRKITDNTVDLAYEGYSAVFDGFTIQVNEADFDRAKKIADDVVKKAHDSKSDAGLSEGSAMRRFYFCSLFAVMIPVIFHGLAIYHLVDGLRRGEKLHPVFATFSLILLSMTGGLIFYLISQNDILSVLRKFAEAL